MIKITNLIITNWRTYKVLRLKEIQVQILNFPIKNTSMIAWERALFSGPIQNLTDTVGNTVYILRKNRRATNVDTTVNNAPNHRRYLLEVWTTKCKDKKNIGKAQNFIKSTRTSSPTGNAGGVSLPPIGESCMHKKTSSKKSGENAFVSFQKKLIIFKLVLNFFIVTDFLQEMTKHWENSQPYR